MIFQEVGWIRANSEKFCPRLTKSLLEAYRPVKSLPCFLQKPLQWLRQRFKKIPVIIQLNEEKLSMEEVPNLASKTGCPVKTQLNIINGFASVVNINHLQQLAGHPGIKRISYDREVNALLDVAAPTVGAPIAWQNELTGRNVTVAVLDTGIYPHPDLINPVNRIVAFKDLVNNRPGPYDDNGHGTHVAGDIAANGYSSEGLYRGPAPEAGLAGVKVLDKMGAGSLSTVIAGLQWCVENKDTYGIRVCNLSLGSAATVPYTQDPVCQAVEQVWKAGIVVCTAAGNDGPQPGTISSPGIDPLILTVGASDDYNTLMVTDDAVAVFSARGPTIDGLAKPDLVAPGANIISLYAPGAKLEKTNPKARVGDWYISLSGTSMATPICSGVTALLLQANPQLTPDDCKQVLMQSGRHLDDNNTNDEGWGLIDAGSALAVEQRFTKNLSG